MKKYTFLHYIGIYSPITIMSATEEAAYLILKRDYFDDFDEYYLK